MKWPLNINNFTILDRLKIAKFILSFKNRWTQDIQVKKIEQTMANFVGCKYAIFVSSGSTANTLLSQYTKDTSKKNIVIFPSTTWQTSCSPWIREGFTPHFIDISLEDFSINKQDLIKFLEKNHKKVACIFPTSLIGFSPNMDFYKEIEKKYKVNIMFDNCENTLGDFKNKNISSYFTSSTSSYFGHQIQSIEGGFIFTNSLKEYEYFLMQRNHGMTRSLNVYGMDNQKYLNKNVSKSFDFYSLGNNFRNTDLNAFIGLLDIKRIDSYKNKRIELFNLYKNIIDNNKYYLPNQRENALDVAFCLPIIVKHKNKDLYNKAINLCEKESIEYRPIISGFLGYQTCYKNYFKNIKNYPNSKYLHDYGFYIGLYSNLNKKKIIDFVNKLNTL